MPNVIFLIDNLRGGGAEKAIKIVSEELALQYPDKVTLVLLENQKDYDLAPHVKCVCLTDSLSLRNVPVAFLRYLRLLFSLKPDLQISANTKSHVFSLVAKLITSTPTNINHQVDLVSHYNSRPFLFKLLTCLYRFADGFSFISRGIYTNLKKYLPERYVFFIPNPVDMEEIRAKSEEALEDEHKDIFLKPVVITAGRLTEQKCQHILLQAFANIKADWHLVILGAGEREKELKELAYGLGISDNVFFLGFQKNPFKFMARADIFVLSSLWEGFGNVIVEAMACGLPVVSTDCPSGPREIIAPGTNTAKNKTESFERAEYGFLVPPDKPGILAEAMSQMMFDQEIRLYYTGKSRKRAMDFSSDKIASAYAEMIQKMRAK